MQRQTAVLAILAMVAAVVPAWGSDDVQTLKAYYDKAITKEIDCAQKLSTLESSRSPNVRIKAHREASKALFLKAYREALIEKMVEAEIPLKDYQVDRFLNEQFSCNCYAPRLVQK